MQLIFHDRRPLEAAPIGGAWLTIERKGTFSLSIAAVATLSLKATDEVVLAEDAETNSWYLVPNPTGELEGFELRPRDTKSKALMFCGQHRARAYYQAHGLGEEKSVRSLVSATAIEHEGVKLYPLTPQHSTKTPAPATAQLTTTLDEALLDRLTEIREKDFPSEVASPADVAPLPSDLPFLQAELPGVTPMVEAAPVASAPALAMAALPESRAEQLADYWNEREVSLAKPEELEEIITVLSKVPKYDRGFTENKVLNQAKTEQAKRVKEAGKKGGARG